MKKIYCTIESFLVNNSADMDVFKRMENIDSNGDNLYVQFTYDMFKLLRSDTQVIDNYFKKIAEFLDKYNIWFRITRGGDSDYFKERFADKSKDLFVEKFMYDGGNVCIINELNIIPENIYDRLQDKECTWVCELFGRLMYYVQKMHE